MIRWPVAVLSALVCSPPALGQVTTRVSVSSAGAEKDADDFSMTPEVSRDGRYVVFSTFATNLVPGDTNGAEDIFLHDRFTQQTVRLSLASNGSEANGSSGAAAVSPDGRFVAFASEASNLDPADPNTGTDIYLPRSDQRHHPAGEQELCGSGGPGSVVRP